MFNFQCSPPDLTPEGRTSDLDAILDVIERAEKYIHIAVTEYITSSINKEPFMYVALLEK